MKPGILIFTILLIGNNNLYSQLSCGQGINLNSWSQQGVLSSGQWTVGSGGNSVTQNINAISTWFISPNDFFNVLIQGKIQVNTSNDDDLIGFVFGYQDPFGSINNPSSTPFETYIFDWKQTSQSYFGNTSNEGFALYKVDGNFNFNNTVGNPGSLIYPELWNRVNSPNVNLIQSNYGNNGWNDFQQYDFQLKYTADSIVIWIDNQIVVQTSGCFEPGRFGFYNQSQDNVIYSDFSYDFEYDFLVQDSIICLNDPANFTIGSGCLNYFPISTSFVWDFGDGQTIAGLNPSHLYSTSGNYIVQLTSTDSFGCVSTHENNIEVLDLETFSAGADGTTCSLNYNLSASANNGFWSGPSGVVFSDPTNPNTLVTVPAIGSYIFAWSPMNGNECSVEDNVTVTFGALQINANLISPDCFSDDTGEIIISVVGGTQPYSFVWNAGAILETSGHLMNLSSGLYSVLITDGSGCDLDTTFFLDEPDPFNFSVNTINSNCDQSNGEIQINSVTGGTSPYFYNWGSGIVNNNFTDNLSSGIYSIELIDGNGCDSAFTVSIDGINLTANIESTNISCFGLADGSLVASGNSAFQFYSFEWSANAGNQITPSVNNLSAGIYSVIVSSSIICADTLEIEIFEPLPMIISQITNSTVCNNQITNLGVSVLGGTQPYTYEWNNGIGPGQHHIVNAEQSTNYEVIITDMNGCEIIDTAFVVVLDSPMVNFEVNDSIACLSSNHEFIFTHTSEMGVNLPIWSFGDGSFSNGHTVSHQYSEVGDFTVSLTIQGQNLCSSTFAQNNYIQILPNPVADFTYSPNTISVVNTSVNFTDHSIQNILLWDWNFNDLDGSNIQNPTFNFPALPGNYTTVLKVEDNYGCIDSIVKNIVIIDEVLLFAPNSFTPNGGEFNSYWRLSISGAAPNSIEIEIYDRWGELIWQSKDINIPWDGTYNGNLVQDGTFIWRVRAKSAYSSDTYEWNGHLNVLK